MTVINVQFIVGTLTFCILHLGLFKAVFILFTNKWWSRISYIWICLHMYWVILEIIEDFPYREEGDGSVFV